MWSVLIVEGLGFKPGKFFSGKKPGMRGVLKKLKKIRKVSTGVSSNTAQTIIVRTHSWIIPSVLELLVKT